ncbi:hypothetical protein BDY19DRAFT_942922 [Irpex rosettiformis]|uniref:Uncharacterized protein n=1 Tax=Irpex rosettiformis TaxID=378272 RepID=A0ACB8U5B4_9APHY|nr:hypothetical protein BDY19DRAFT_942922 [Irpex rosettiformis]
MTTLTIPGTFAYHVVGKTSTELANGDLTIIASTSDIVNKPARHPVLVLSVAQAAFQIYEDTVFGTVEGDERVYVFKPDLGEGISGYVKLILPEGVSEAGSEFAALQERFERILINHGLLNEGEGTPPEGSVTVPSASASHVLGKTTVDLAKGDLTLASVTPSQSKDSEPVLVLTVGEAAFPLYPTTTFGTVADDELVYVFKPETQVGSLPIGGYIKITFPDEHHGLTEELQEKFEQLLIDHSLLKTGVLAAGDEVSRSVNEDATSAAESIHASTANFLAKHPPTHTPLAHSSTTHSLAASASSATTTLHHAAQSISSAVSSVASSAGAFLSSRLTGGPPSEETKEAVHTAGDVYDSVGAGPKIIKDVVYTSSGDVLESDWGQETRDIGGNVTGVVADMEGAVGQAAKVGTGAALVSGGVKGGVGATDAPQSSEEREAFTIEEKPDEDEDWKDVPV